MKLGTFGVAIGFGLGMVAALVTHNTGAVYPIAVAGAIACIFVALAENN